MPLYRSVALVTPYICWYKFTRTNSSVRMALAMDARITGRLWDIGDILKLIEEWHLNQITA